MSPTETIRNRTRLGAADFPSAVALLPLFDSSEKGSVRLMAIRFGVVKSKRRTTRSWKLVRVKGNEQDCCNVYCLHVFSVSLERKFRCERNLLFGSSDPRGIRVVRIDESSFFSYCTLPF
jgi:hypothetical protein